MEREQLIHEIKAVEEELAATLAGFQNVVDPELIEFYTYAYKTIGLKHSYLLKQLKALDREASQKIKKISAEKSDELN